MNTPLPKSWLDAEPSEGDLPDLPILPETLADLRLHLQLQQAALATDGVLAAPPELPRIAIDWKAIRRRSAALSLEQHRELRAASEQSMRELEDDENPARAMAPAVLLATTLPAMKWAGWLVAAVALLGVVSLPHFLNRTESAQTTLQPATAQVAEGPADSHRFVLPDGAVATLHDQAKLTVASDDSNRDRLEQTAGRVKYSFGEVETTVQAPFGTLSGVNADAELILNAGTDSFGSVVVHRGQVRLVDADGMVRQVDAGQTAYFNPQGQMQVQVSSAPAPVFELPTVVTVDSTPFHPDEPNAVAPVLTPTPTATQNRNRTQTQTRLMAGTAAAHAAPGAPGSSTPPTVTPDAGDGTATQPADPPAVSSASAAPNSPSAALPPPLADLPPDDLPPDDFTPGNRGNGGNGAPTTSIALPPTPTPGNSNGNDNASGNGNSSANGTGWGGTGNSGLHLGQGNGNAGGNGNGSSNSNVGGNDKSKIKSK